MKGNKKTYEEWWSKIRYLDAKESKTIPKNIIGETTSFFILLAFLFTTTVLLIAVSIYCYLIKYIAKQKHLRPFYVTNNRF